MASYLYYNYSKDILPKKAYFLMPCSDLFIYFFLTLGAKMGNIIGVRLTICVALFFKYISYALLLMIPNYYIVLISMCLFGVGSGLGNLTYLKNSWKYFKKRQGLVNGIILGGAGISSSLLTPLADFFIINPEKKQADSKTGLYYDKVIANRVPKYIAILCIMFLILGLISIFITFPYKEEKNEENGEKSKNSQSLEEKNAENQVSLVKLFLSKQNLKLLSFCFCGFCK